MPPECLSLLLTCRQSTQWHGGAEVLELTADRGGQQITIRIEPEDVEISNSSPPSKQLQVQHQTDTDAALGIYVRGCDLQTTCMIACPYACERSVDSRALRASTGRGTVQRPDTSVGVCTCLLLLLFTDSLCQIQPGRCTRVKWHRWLLQRRAL